MFGAVLISAILAAAAPAAAPSAPQPAPTAAAPNTVAPAVVQGKEKDDPNKLVCHMETPVGSRLAVKKCMTKGEADMRRFEDRQSIEKMQGDTYRR